MQKNLLLCFIKRVGKIKDLHIYEDKTKGAMGKQMKKIREMITTYHSQQGGENDAVTMMKALL